MSHNTYTLYQVRENPETPDYLFSGLEQLKAKALTVKAANYKRVYNGSLEPEDVSAPEALSRLWYIFNADHPKDYIGRSMSVSDVVVLCQVGKPRAYYVDSFGFKEVPEFLTAPLPGGESDGE
jgi:hypothetical protein